MQQVCSFCCCVSASTQRHVQNDDSPIRQMDFGEARSSFFDWAILMCGNCMNMFDSTASMPRGTLSIGRVGLAHMYTQLMILSMN